MSIPKITPAQTAAKQPLNEFLMESLRQRSTYVPVGTIFYLYDFAGLLDTPEGFLLCSGVVINETNYNIQHSSRGGLWAEEIGVSPLLNRYTPNLADRYLTAGASTQSGNTAITTVGNPNYDLTIAHDHNISSHTHGLATHKHPNGSISGKLTSNNTLSHQITYTQPSSGGTTVTLATASHAHYFNWDVDTLNNTTTPQGGSRTPTSSSSLTNRSVQPESIVAKAWIRII